jgi:uncharacterized cupredoxin-like copper-binding protein
MKTPLISALLLAAFILSACSGAAPAATQPPVQDTQVPVKSSSGGATTVDITLADNTIQASQTTFQAGVPYTFVITNTGRHAHNLNISTPVSVAGSLNAAVDSALLKVDQDQLSPGASATVQYTFPDSAAGQPLEFSCLIKRHYEDQMYLAITVTK